MTIWQALEPVVNVTFGALDVDPQLVLPNAMILVLDWSLIVNPPVPV